MMKMGEMAKREMGKREEKKTFVIN